MAKKEVVNNDALTLRVSEPLGDILEETSDFIEDQVDRVITVTKNNPLVIAGALALGLGIGGVIAYRVAVKRTTLKYELILEEEIASAKNFYKRLAKEGEFETPESAVEALVPDTVIDAIQSYRGRERGKIAYDKVRGTREAPIVEVETVEVTNNVFVQSKTDPRDWDYDLEIATRTPDKPYVISFEEFVENVDNNEQSTLSYFIDDDTLVDEREQPIDNTEYTVGDDNLLRFGHGSNDKHVVYVRNERISMDFEIVQAKGSYAKDVLGLDPKDEIRHAHQNSSRKFRRTDE